MIPLMWSTIYDFRLDHENLISWASSIFVALFLPYIAHRLLLLFDYPVLAIRPLVEQLLVSLMPQRLVDVLAIATTPGTSSGTSAAADAKSEGSWQTKSDILKNVFGLAGSALSGKTSSSDAPPGLGNWDNSCYQNSVLQALSSLQRLKAYLQDCPRQDEDAKTTVAALGILVADLNEPKNRGRKLWTPQLLKSMSSWQQQDAQEYYSKILDSVELDLKKQTQVTRDSPDVGLQGIVACGKASLSGTESHGGTDRQVRSHSTLPIPLEGFLSQRVGCTSCGYVDGLSLIPFNCLTLSPGNSPACTLSDCLNEYTALEIIEGVECAKCTLQNTQIQLRRLLEKCRADRLKEEADDAKCEPDPFEQSLAVRAEKVTTALQEEDFREATLAKKCQIPNKLRTASTKSKQATVMRAPECLAIHINRSLFDEHTGALMKNHADVAFPSRLDLSPWCAGGKSMIEQDIASTSHKQWEMDPRKSMLSHVSDRVEQPPQEMFELRSIVTHHGRHENGHYICYRKFPRRDKKVDMSSINDDELEGRINGNNEAWWRLSDEDVSRVTEQTVLSQGGVFMLFYERIRPTISEMPAAQRRVENTFTGIRAATPDIHELVSEVESDEMPEVQSENEERLGDETWARSTPPVATSGPHQSRVNKTTTDWPTLRTAGPRRRHSSDRSQFPTLPMLTT